MVGPCKECAAKGASVFVVAMFRLCDECQRYMRITYTQRNPEGHLLIGDYFQGVVIRVEFDYKPWTTEEIDD